MPARLPALGAPSCDQWLGECRQLSATLIRRRALCVPTLPLPRGPCIAGRHGGCTFWHSSSRPPSPGRSCSIGCRPPGAEIWHTPSWNRRSPTLRRRRRPHTPLRVHTDKLAGQAGGSNESPRECTSARWGRGCTSKGIRSLFLERTINSTITPVP